MWLNIHIYIYTHKQNQNHPTKIKYNRLTQRTKETKNYIYHLRIKLTKAQTEVYDNNKNYDWEKKSLIRFYSAIKIDNYNRGAKEKEKKKKEKNPK